jgi:Kef-type K+ transport system membrane component KefB
VLGELLAGVIIGPGVLGLVHESQVLHALAELGVLILLFEVGLESDLGELLRVGLQATLVALVGVAVPFAVGYAVMDWLGHPALLAVFVGVTFTATNVGITARVLRDIGRLHDSAAKVVLGAAVVDDILGLIILAVVSGVAQPGSVSLATVGLLSGKAVAFLVVAILLGIRLAPALIRWIGLMQARGSPTTSATASPWRSTSSIMISSRFVAYSGIPGSRPRNCTPRSGRRRSRRRWRSTRRRRSPC